MIVSNNGIELTSNTGPRLVRGDRGRVALHRPTQADANGYVEGFNGRMRDELLNDTLFIRLDHACAVIAARADDDNRERPHSALDCETPAAFAAELDK